mmetsp:Transcript_11245/g.28438  ORF Transcript_11245/g.28438 Transcript_11245/m.28438 type:complete len:350 (+) Transcript_11245:1203-2252(+)
MGLVSVADAHEQPEVELLGMDEELDEAAEMEIRPRVLERHEPNLRCLEHLASKIVILRLELFHALRLKVFLKRLVPRANAIEYRSGKHVLGLGGDRLGIQAHCRFCGGLVDSVDETVSRRQTVATERLAPHRVVVDVGHVDVVELNPALFRRGGGRAVRSDSGFVAPREHVVMAAVRGTLVDKHRREPVLGLHQRAIRGLFFLHVAFNHGVELLGKALVVCLDGIEHLEAAGHGLDRHSIDTKGRIFSLEPSEDARHRVLEGVVNIREAFEVVKLVEAVLGHLPLLAIAFHGVADGLGILAVLQHVAVERNLLAKVEAMVDLLRGLSLEVVMDALQINDDDGCDLREPH